VFVWSALPGFRVSVGVFYLLFFSQLVLIFNVTNGWKWGRRLHVRAGTVPEGYPMSMSCPAVPHDIIHAPFL
jgi:hypothetical protein